MGTTSNWVKTSGWGDYKQTPDRINARERKTYQQRVIDEVRKAWLYGKTAGSKSLVKLRGTLKRYKETSSKFKRK